MEFVSTQRQRRRIQTRSESGATASAVKIKGSPCQQDDHDSSSHYLNGIKSGIILPEADQWKLGKHFAEAWCNLRALCRFQGQHQPKLSDTTQETVPVKPAPSATFQLNQHPQQHSHCSGID